MTSELQWHARQSRTSRRHSLYAGRRKLPPTGEPVATNALGLPDEITDALGRVTRFGYDATGNITSVVEAADMLRSPPQNTATRFELDVYGRPTAVVAPNGATTRYIRDDFGQTLATVGADSGKTTRRFDAA